MLSPDTEYDTETLTGDHTGAWAERARFLECTLEDCDLTEARLPRARFTDTRLVRVTGTGTDLSETEWLDCTVTASRLGAVQMYAATMRRVRFEGGKIDFLNLRGARLREVRFVDCILTELDLAEALLTDVTFEGCRLLTPDFGRARLSGVDLTAADLVAPKGVASLSGATVSRLQLLDLAPALAAELGISVEE